MHQGQSKYLVKWLGYPCEQNSWVPESDMVSPPIHSMQFTSDISPSKPTKCSLNVQPKSHYLSALACWILGILAFFVICVSFSSSVNINIGPLYDCSRVYHTALYKFTNHVQCEHKMHLSESKVKYFQADVLQYSPRTTHLTIYHCTAQRLRMTMS